MKWLKDSPLRTHPYGHRWGSLAENQNFCVSPCLKPFFDDMMTIPVIKRDIDKRNIEGAILQSFKTKDADIDIGEIYQFLNEKSLKAAPILTALYKLFKTRGHASARVECLFSAMSYVDAQRRRRITSS